MTPYFQLLYAYLYMRLKQCLEPVACRRRRVNDFEKRNSCKNSWSSFSFFFVVRVFFFFLTNVVLTTEGETLSFTAVLSSAAWTLCLNQLTAEIWHHFCPRTVSLGGAAMGWKWLMFLPYSSGSHSGGWGYCWEEANYFHFNIIFFFVPQWNYSVF